MDAISMVIGYFMGLLWMAIPILLMIFVGGACMLLFSNNPDLFKRHPHKVKVWRDRGEYLVSETRGGRYDSNKGIKFFKIKGIKHQPILELKPEYKDPNGYFNFREIRNDIYQPFIISSKKKLAHLPIVTPKFIEQTNEKGEKVLAVATREMLNEKGEKIVKPIYEFTGEYTIETQPVDTMELLSKDNAYLMLNMASNELGKNRDVLTPPSWVEQNKNIIMFITTGALCVLMMIIVIQQGVLPTIDKITSLAAETAKQNTLTSQALANVTKYFSTRGYAP